jgi:hypothetical protein
MNEFPLTLSAVQQAVNSQEAKKNGFAPITTCYAITEWWMLEGALQSLVSSNRRYLLVSRIAGHEIWIPKPQSRKDA